MDVLVAFLVIFVLPGIAAGLARRHQRSGAGFYLLTFVLGLVTMGVALNISQSGTVGAFVGLGFGVLGIICAGLSRSASRIAEETGNFGDFVKCEYCAESIRRAAKICKHCHSTVTAHEAN